ncbi:MAG: alpha-hydroxy-acid oxidizing protein [Treponema lecithinolyticum]|uniref:alpha-hydroxy-acid oxidizing protein n=1 Tax=Treponema lecithinolyticum TaxID=53418 RepID=UPI003FA284B2
MCTHSFKCRFCAQCDGFGCTGELPGMGGFSNNINFQLNCAAWDNLDTNGPFALPDAPLPSVRLAPITGAVENIGYTTEQSFYFDMIEAADKAGVKLSIGDGYPDIKLQSGIRAVQKRQLTNPMAQAAVFIKPYPNERIFERLEWSYSVAEIIGIDIDSYNILTMRRLVQLEKKTAAKLIELKHRVHIPFALKGIFTAQDVDLVKQVKPDIVVISNHGGRVENRIGSTAEFLAEYGVVLKNQCKELWVDGGIRKLRDIQAAGAWGVAQVMVGRPFITALCSAGTKGVERAVKNLYSPHEGSQTLPLSADSAAFLTV